MGIMQTPQILNPETLDYIFFFSPGNCLSLFQLFHNLELSLAYPNSSLLLISSLCITHENHRASTWNLIARNSRRVAEAKARSPCRCPSRPRKGHSFPSRWTIVCVYSPQTWPLFVWSWEPPSKHFATLIKNIKFYSWKNWCLLEELKFYLPNITGQMTRAEPQEAFIWYLFHWIY